MKQHRNLSLILCLVLGLSLFPLSCAKKAVQEDSTVKVHYTGKLKDGSVFDSSTERGPMEVTLGQGKLIPGFENALIGMKAGEKKTVTIPVDQAYGPHREELVKEIDRGKLPPDQEPEVGQTLYSRGPEGRGIPLKILEVKEKTVILDANHPLAGQDLIFDLEVVEILK